MVGVGWACTCSSIFILVKQVYFNTVRTFVLSFGHSSPVTTQMCTCYGSFCVKTKGVTYERVHTGIDLYMCVHIIQRYDDTMREKGGEGGRKGYICIKIYRVGPFLSAVLFL